MYQSDYSSANFDSLSLWFVQDTYKGRICECPPAHGIQYSRDGYTSCHHTPFLHPPSHSLSIVSTSFHEVW